MQRSRFFSLLVLAGLGLAIGTTQYAFAATQITGAGASFPFPFYSRAFYEYGRLHPDVQVNYQSIGSGGGIQQFTAKTVDFGASDVPLNANEMKAAVASGGDVVEFPTTIGGVVVAYNVPGAPTHIKLDQPTLANIFLGEITNWNDAAIAKTNAGANLPNLSIVVAHRADGSGTTYIFTDYLSKISPEWKTKVGNAKVVNWPAASSVGAKGNEGVAGTIKNTPGAIGYVELAYALQTDITYAALRNSSGAFVAPSVDTVREAAEQKPNVSPDDFSIVDMTGKGTYPIAGYSWVMLWKNQPDSNKGKQLVNLFRWVVTDGQPYAERLRYVGLPKSIQAQNAKVLAGVKT
ncbi:MAG TPA: phosphate ABC transporter substrate-binding protein PstS [Candidatus Eremiobacteraceae bacterium]|nr:phosphate ABC transporter substrate-binding protein PstS [Candidatus Eremiobacteraceae bacterium]